MDQNSTIKIIKAKSRQTIIIEDDLGKTEWIVRPISTFELIEYEELFKSLPSEEEEDNIKAVKEGVLPLINKILPMCCISPKITLDRNDPDLENEEGNTVHLFDIGIERSAQILNKLVEISGLTKDSEKARKKLSNRK